MDQQIVDLIKLRMHQPRAAAAEEIVVVVRACHDGRRSLHDGSDGRSRYDLQPDLTLHGQDPIREDESVAVPCVALIVI